MVSVRAYAPAQLHSVGLMNYSALSGLLLQGAVHVPFSLEMGGNFVHGHFQAVYHYVSQILSHQVPLGNVIAGVYVPALVHGGGAVFLEVYIQLETAHPLAVCPCVTQGKQKQEEGEE